MNNGWNLAHRVDRKEFRRALLLLFQIDGLQAVACAQFFQQDQHPRERERGLWKR